MNNYTQSVFEQSSQYPDKLAVVDDNYVFSYQELENQVKYFAHYLESLGLLPQQRIILYFDDCVEWYVAFLASVAVGVNPVCFSHLFPLSTVANTIDFVDAYAIVTDKELESNCNIIQIHKSQILNSSSEQISKYYDYHSDELCLWLLSSGTTGHPKAVIHRHDNFKNYFVTSRQLYQIDSSSNILSTAKLSFTYGLNMNMVIGLSSGATSYLINGIPAPTKIFDIINKNSITHFFTVPAIITSILKHGKNKILPDSLTHMYSAGEHLQLATFNQFKERFGISIINTLGMSETMAMYLIQHEDNFEEGTVGSTFPECECQLRNDDGNIVPDGEVGEMFVKSLCLATMYWKDWTYTKKTFQGEWLKTGDKFKKTKNGNYQYVSRADDLLKINGLFVSPLEIESAMLQLPQINDCAVYIKTHDDGRKEVHAFIISDSGIAVPEIQEFLKNKLKSIEVPQYFHFISELPKTITGKKMRYKLFDLI